MKYCQTCLIPGTRLLGRFSTEWIYTTCEFTSRSNQASYETQFTKLRLLIRNILKARTTALWDGIFRVSRGKDNTRQALWVMDKLEIWAHRNAADRAGRYNAVGRTTVLMPKVLRNHRRKISRAP